MYCECSQFYPYFSLLACLLTCLLAYLLTYLLAYLLAYTSVVPSCMKAAPAKVKVLQMGSKWEGNWQLYFLSYAGRLLDYTFSVPVVATCVFHNLCNPSQGGILCFGGKYHLGAGVSSLTGPICGGTGREVEVYFTLAHSG